MKNIFKIATLLLSLSCLASCCGSSPEMSEPSVKMLARVAGFADKIEVEVIEGEYGVSGIFWVITSSQTEFKAKNGAPTVRDALNVGDTVEITYGGQVMMSYPPQIVAKNVKIV